MISQTKTFLFPINDGRFGYGDLQIVAIKPDINKNVVNIETISYRPDKFSPWVVVTQLLDLHAQKLREELKWVAYDQFIEEDPEEEQEEDTREYELHEISKSANY